MLAVGPLGPQYCWLFALYKVGRQAHLGRRHPPYPLHCTGIISSTYFWWCLRFSSLPNVDEHLSHGKLRFSFGNFLFDGSFLMHFFTCFLNAYLFLAGAEQIEQNKPCSYSWTCFLWLKRFAAFLKDLQQISHISQFTWLPKFVLTCT